MRFLQVLTVLVGFLAAQSGYAGDNLTPVPQGYYGVGHEEWHSIYMTLHNQWGVSCCDGGDCRPTTAKYEDGQWRVEVDGVWKPVDLSRFTKEAPYSWSETAHVCADKRGYIYCFVPEGIKG